jgi:hypothetical protein
VKAHRVVRSRLTDGSEVVSLTRLPPFTPPRIFLVLISVRGWVNPRAIVRLEGWDKQKKTNDLIGIWARDLPACSIVPQATTLPCAPNNVTIYFIFILCGLHVSKHQFYLYAIHIFIWPESLTASVIFTTLSDHGTPICQSISSARKRTAEVAISRNIFTIHNHYVVNPTAWVTSCSSNYSYKKHLPCDRTWVISAASPFFK